MDSWKGPFKSLSYNTGHICLLKFRRCHHPDLGSISSQSADKFVFNQVARIHGFGGGCFPRYTHYSLAMLSPGYLPYWVL